MSTPVHKGFNYRGDNPRVKAIVFVKDKGEIRTAYWFFYPCLTANIPRDITIRMVFRILSFKVNSWTKKEGVDI